MTKKEGEEKGRENRRAREGESKEGREEGKGKASKLGGRLPPGAEGGWTSLFVS